MAAQDAYECDVLVIGSGAAGMSAAVTAASHGLKVSSLKRNRVRRTTARSAAGCGSPGRRSPRRGASKSPELARTYLRHEAGISF